MKIKMIYFIGILILFFIVMKYWDFSKKYSEIRFNNTNPVIRLDQLINVEQEKINYLKSLYYQKEWIGFNATIDNQYITVTKLGKSKEKMDVFQIKKNLSNNDIIALPPSDTNDVIARYIDFSQFPSNINDLFYYTDGFIVKTYESEFKEITFNASKIDFVVDTKNNRKYFGYVGAKQISSVSFISFQENLYLISTHPIEGHKFKSLHEILNDAE